MIAVLARTVLEDIVCNGANHTICSFTKCQKNEYFELEYSGDLESGVELTVFADSSCQPANVLIDGTLELKSILNGAVSAFIPDITNNLERIEISLNVNIVDGWLGVGSLFALYTTSNAYIDNIVMTGSFSSMGSREGENQAIFGGLISNANKSLVVAHIGVYGVVISFASASQSGLIIGLFYNATSLEVSHIIIVCACNTKNFANFDLDTVYLRPDVFYCESRNLDFELRMKEYLLSNDCTGIRSELEAHGSAISALIGNFSFASIVLSEIGIDADIGFSSSYYVGFLIGYANKLDLMTIEATHVEGLIDMSATGGAIGIMRGLAEHEYNLKLSCAFKLSQNVVGYVGMIAETNQGSIVLSAAIDVEIKGEYSGGIVGILKETNLTIAEVIGRVAIVSRDTLQGLLIGKWTTTDYEIPRGYVDGEKCASSAGCVLDEAENAKLNEECIFE